MESNDLISKLSEIRSEYNCFDEDEEPYYRALSEAIMILSRRADEDTISRQDAINALWKALYEYEDKTEKQFIESEDLDVRDWILHRIFVQNMSDIDRQTILNLPSAQSANSSKISYSVICEKFPNPHIYFNTYDEAEHWARFNQPNDRPYYIIKRSEHFEIVGEVK